MPKNVKLWRLSSISRLRNSPQRIIYGIWYISLANFSWEVFDCYRDFYFFYLVLRSRVEVIFHRWLFYLIASVLIIFYQLYQMFTSILSLCKLTTLKNRNCIFSFTISTIRLFSWHVCLGCHTLFSSVLHWMLDELFLHFSPRFCL